MNFFSILFLILLSFSNFVFANGKSDDFKTTGQKLREQGFSDQDLCKTACESEFSACYKNDKKNILKCVDGIITCKKECFKERKKTK